MGTSVYRQAPESPGGAPRRRPINPVGPVATIAVLALPCASTLVGGNLAGSLVPLGSEFAHRAFAWSAVASAVVVAAAGLLIALVSSLRKQRPDATSEPDFRPWSARVVLHTFAIFAVATPIWLLLTLWLSLVLCGVTLYLDVRHAEAPREATCDVRRCRTFRCAVTCTRSDGGQTRGTFVKTREAPQAEGRFHAQVRRGRFGTWFLDLASVRRLPARDTTSGGAR